MSCFNHKFTIAALFVLFCCSTAVFGQVGIGTQTPDQSAVLEVQSADRGVLIPRIDNLDNIATPAEGLLVYLTTEKQFYFYDGSSWKSINPWSFSAPNNTDITQNIPKNTGVGENVPGSKLSVKGNLAVGSTYAGYQGDGGTNPFPPSNGALIEGSVGIGTTAPTEKLEVRGNVQISGAFYGMGAVPLGGIIMWSGGASSVPDGWALCDGQKKGGYTTPDLRGRFIAGLDPADVDYGSAGNLSTKGTSVGKRGGLEAVTLNNNQIPIHDHSMTHGHSINDPGHNHGIDLDDAGGSGGIDDAGESSEGSTRTNNATTGISINNYNGRTGDAGGSQAHENRPPYYTLAFIMRVQ